MEVERTWMHGDHLIFKFKGVDTISDAERLAGADVAIPMEARAQVAELESAVKEMKGVKVLAVQVPGMDREQLRTLVDSLRAKWKSMVVVLASSEDSNVSIVSGVTKDLTSRVHAGKLVGAVAQAVGGKGGGRPDMAEGGGKNPSALPAALEAVYNSVEGML